MNYRMQLAGLAVSAFLATPAWADQSGATLAWAEVIEATPVRQEVRIPESGEACWDEEVYREVRARHSATPRILGAILGGVVGNQFGGGSGRDLMTAAGAALGSSVAADQQHRNNPDRYYASTERRCAEQKSWRIEERIIAWDVTYEYRGETYQARVTDAPGDRIRIRVDVTPVGG